MSAIQLARPEDAVSIKEADSHGLDCFLLPARNVANYLFTWPYDHDSVVNAGEQSSHVGSICCEADGGKGVALIERHDDVGVREGAFSKIENVDSPRISTVD